MPKPRRIDWKFVLCEVMNEEIVIHFDVKRWDNGRYVGEARIAGDVKIEGQDYEFNYCVPIRLKKKCKSRQIAKANHDS